MRFAVFCIAASAFTLVPAASFAQPSPAASPAPNLTVGVTIYDPQGGEVGKVKSVADSSVVIDTGTHEAALAKTAFTSGAKGPVLNATKAQIDAQVAALAQKNEAELTAALVAGAEVRGKLGAVIGTVKEVTGDQVVIQRPTGAVSLTKKAFALGPQGLTISWTEAALDAAVSSSGANP